MVKICIVKIKIYQVDAFTENPLSGNPAGVVPWADGMDEKTMQGIAREMNVSETVFVFHKDLSKGCDYRVRFFTPTTEVDYCGHGTIAAAHLLRELEVISRNSRSFRQGMNQDTWEISVEGDLLWILQGPVQMRRLEVDRGELGFSLGLDPTKIKEITWADAGNAVLLCEISDRNSLDTMKPDWNALLDSSKRYEVKGIHCYALDPHDPSNHISTRVFAPLYGVQEDPATGSTTSSLAFYLLSSAKLNPKDGILRIEQGIAMGRPSLLFARMANQKEGSYVEVGGKAITVLSGEIQL